MLVQQTTKNKKEKDQDNTKTTTGGLASWTLGILFLFLVAIPMQSIKAITTATTTSWAYLINKMIGKMHTSNGSPEGAKTEKTGERVKQKQKRKLPINTGRATKKKRKIKKKKTSWKLLKWGLKSLFLVSVFFISTQSLTLNSANTQKRIYNLAHDKTIVNLPGSAFPINHRRHIRKPKGRMGPPDILGVRQTNI